MRILLLQVWLQIELQAEHQRMLRRTLSMGVVVEHGALERQHVLHVGVCVKKRGAAGGTGGLARGRGGESHRDGRGVEVNRAVRCAPFPGPQWCSAGSNGLAGMTPRSLVGSPVS